MRSNGRLANDAWEALLTAHAVLIKHLDTEDIWRGISMREYDVLYTLSKCAGALRLSELNRHVLLSQPALSRMVDRLVGRGLVTRTPDPADGRGVMLALSEQGRAEQRRIGGRHAVSVAQTLTARLTPRELAELERLCCTLADPAADIAPSESTTDQIVTGA
jgi:DNA-binding MarR family transcriptional regulator